MLDIAAQIAGFGGRTLTVVSPPDLGVPEEFEAWVSGLVEDRSLPLQTELAASEPGALAQRVGELDCRLLVLDARAAGAGRQIGELVERITCDVLVIGHGEAQT